MSGWDAARWHAATGELDATERAALEEALGFGTKGAKPRQTQAAIKELEEGARLAPQSPEMHFALARAYTRVGRKADAARERELFKKLQDEFEASRVRRAGAGSDDNQSKPKP